MDRDPYKVLGVNPDADDKEIRRAHRRLVKRFHPDVGLGYSEAEFREVQDAYDTLSDPEKRYYYDRSRSPREGRPENWAAQWYRSGPSPEGYHLDLRNLRAHRRADPSLAYRRREAPGTGHEDPLDVFRRYFDLWLSDDWW